MTLKLPGKPPVPVAPLPTPKPQVTPEGAKSAFLGVLGRAVTYDAAAKMIEEATFRVVGNTLEIQTNISAPLMNMLFEGEVHTLLDGALAERGAGNIKIKFLPALWKETATESPVSEMLSAPFKRLAESAAKLNKVSDQLTIQIEQIDAALKRLNLGVTAWVTISENEDEDGNWSQEQIGYVRIGSRWGIALRSRSAVRGDPGDPDETFSAFADAPRQLRIRAVEFIPKLLDQISAEAEAMVAKLSPKIDEISKLTLAFNTFNDVSAAEVKK
jgi:hypothetical protein